MSQTGVHYNCAEEIRYSHILLAYHCLDHVGSLCSQVFDSVEDINYALCLHPLNGCTQSTEGTGSTDSSTEGERRRGKIQWRWEIRMGTEDGGGG